MSLLKTIKFITNHPLNKQNKIKAIIRFVQWQVGSRLVTGNIVYNWINGSRFLVKTGETGLTGNIYTGLHEFQDMAFLLHVLRSDDVFVDVGANVGSYTILASSVVGARSYAFEPVPSTYSRLVDNVRLNHLDELVNCINKGVGEKVGNMHFTIDLDTTNHVLANGENIYNSINVEVTSLDNALKGTSPTFMKIDVEGYETLVLQGADNILNNQALHSVIMELNGSGERYGFDESRIIALMYDYGFTSYSYDPMNRILIDLGGKILNIGNTLFVRNKALVLDRLMNAPKTSVHGREF